jgi:predicted neuraminidase
MRDHSAQRKVAAARSSDAGQTWHDLPPLALDNPDASVAALGLAPGRMVMAHNPSTTGREALRLSQSADGLAWTSVATLAEAPAAGKDAATPPAEFSYPALAWADGSLWVSYTDQRSRISWVQLRAAP